MENDTILVVRYNKQTATSEEVEQTCEVLQEKVGSHHMVVGLADDMSLKTLSYDELIQIQARLAELINDLRYKRRCQFNESGLKPCEIKALDCEDCDEYYSDEDTRW